MSDEPIRVAQMMTDMNYGGVEMVVTNYYRNIDKRKVQFDFFAFEGSSIPMKEEIEKSGGRVYIIPKYTHILKYEKAIIKLFKENDYKIVHSHMNTLSVFSLLGAKIAGIPIRIAHNHSVPAGNEFKRNLLKKFLKLFSKVFATDYFACSEKAGRWLFGDKEFNKGNVIVLKNAIDFNRFQFNKQEKEKIRNDLGIGDKIIIGHVGRFTYAKNHTLLLKVFKEIYINEPRCRLLLVGDGELHEQIINTIKELQIEDAVLLVGKVSDTEKYYSVMDILILPSFFEGIPLTAIEAQVSGVPVLLSDVVPMEAIISKSYKFLNISESIDTWSEEAFKLIGKRNVLTEESNLYDITKTAPKLAEWYISRINSL